MTVELRMLTPSVVLGTVQIIVASHVTSLQRGYRWTASPRDIRDVTTAGSGQALGSTALHNFLKSFPLFVAVVFGAHVLDKHNTLAE